MISIDVRASSGDRYPAEQARSMGLIDEIHDDARLAAEQFVECLAPNAPLSIAGAKFVLNSLSLGAGALDLAAAQRLIDAPTARILRKADGPSREKGLRDFAANNNRRAGKETSLEGRSR
jgi:enoyl-CoA hydratase/carnithine racemase